MWPYPRIVAHRGGGKLAPENTLAALQCGLMHGFHAVEFDVMLAKDGVPILMHDAHLGRTVAGRGNVADFTAQELGAMDAGSWFGAAFAGEPPPTYFQGMQFCKQNSIWMNVEIKPTPGCEVDTGQVVAAATQHFFEDESNALPLLSSFSFDALMAAKTAAPRMARAYLVDRIPLDWQTRLHALDAVALHTNHAYLSATAAAGIKAAGFGLFCYTVNDPARAREILAWGVDGFCTDRIDLIGPRFS